MKTAIEKLKRAIAEQDSYGVLPDSCCVYLDNKNCLYELNIEDMPDGRITLGDLRAIVAEAEQST